MPKKKMPRQGSKLSSAEVLDFQTAFTLVDKLRKPVAGSNHHGDLDTHELSVKEAMSCDIACVLFDKYRFFSTEYETAICKVATGHTYFYTDLRDPVFSYIISMHGLANGMELDEECFEIIIFILSAYTLFRRPLIEQDELKYTVRGGF